MSERAKFRRNISVLATCQALFFMCNTIIISTVALVGLQLAPAAALATVPLGVQFLGTMACTLPASLLMKRIGRRPGLMLGAVLGVISGLLSFYAVMAGSFLWFCVGGVLYGGFAAFSQYFRFAAADAADLAANGHAATAARGRAIAWVMAGGVVAGVLGPQLAVWTRDLMEPILFAGVFLTVAVLAALVLAALAFLDLPLPSQAERSVSGRPIGAILRQPAALTALLAALIGYVTMNMLMTAIPLAMLACGHAFADSAFVIQWHVVGMFAPSFVTGHLITRFGVHRVILAGILLNMLCVVVALSGVEVATFAGALFLLGVGWNFMFVGGTTLLTTCHSPAEKAKVQGMNDLLVFGSVTASATLAGWLHEWLGWDAMNLLAVPALVLVGMLVAPQAIATRSSAAPAR